MGGPERDLGALQRWFQAAVTDPGGAREGPEAHLSPSRRLAPAARLAVYAEAYALRLVECLEAQYPALRRALGAEGFRAFALAYLEERPPRHWSLDRLGAGLSEFLARTRPPRAGEAPDWADLLVDLADLEWSVLEVFDGPGIERREVVTAAELAAVPPERWPEWRVTLAPSLALRSYRFPLHRHYAALRDAAEGQAVPLPAPAVEHLALHRLRWRVHRFPLEPAERALLAALAAGETVGAAIARAAAGFEGDDADLAGALRRWFERWTASAFLLALVPPEGQGA